MTDHQSGQILELAQRARKVPRVVAYTGVLVAIFIGLFALTPASDIALPDEGVYLAQAAALHTGSWWTERALPRVNPSMYDDAVIPEVTRGGRMVPYSRRPLLPVLLTAGFAVAGAEGALAVTLIALLVAAVTSARLAAHLDRRAEIPTLYVVALGSPLIFSGWQVSGHAPAAAAAAIGGLAAWHCCRRGKWTWWVAMITATLAAVMFRSEALVLAAVTAAFLAFGGVVATSRRRTLHPALLAGVVVGIAGGAAHLLNSWWFRSITGSGRTVSGLGYSDSIRHAPASAAWIALLQPWDGTATNANKFLLLAVVCLLAAAIAWRLAPQRPLAAIVLLAAGVATAVLAHTATPALVNGMLPAFALLPAGLVLLDRDSFRNPTMMALLGICVVSATWTCFLVYDDGGSTQWGGRFFHLLVPLLAPLITVAAVRSLSDVAQHRRRVAFAAAALVAVAISAIGVRTEIQYRQVHRDARVAASSEIPRRPSGISDRSALVASTRLNDGFSRTFWRNDPDFVTIRASIPNVFDRLLKLHKRGLREAWVITPGDPDLMELGGRYDLAALGWKRLSTYRVPGTSIQILHYGPAATS